MPDETAEGPSLGPIPDDRADDPRSDIEQAVQSRSDEADAARGGGTKGVAADPGQPDGVGGTGGDVKNQDRTQQ